MIASSLGHRMVSTRNADRPLRESPLLMVVLVVILALVNVSATFMMAQSWAKFSAGMLELEWIVQDHPAEHID